MKRTFIFVSLLLIAGVYFSCNNSTTGPGNNNNTLTPVSTISGKIQSWTLGNKTLWVLSHNYTILTSSNIDSSGNFSINFPGTINDTSLITPSFSSDSNCSYQINVIPADLKYTISYFAVMNDSTLIGYIYKEAGNQLYAGYKSLEYYYYDSAGSINGTGNCHYGTTENGTYAISFPKGWYYEVLTIDSNSNNYLKFHINNTEPAGLTWIFHSIDYKLNADKYFKNK